MIGNETAAPPPSTAARGGATQIATDLPPGCRLDFATCCTIVMIASIMILLLLFPYWSTIIFDLIISRDPNFYVKNVSVSPYNVSSEDALMTARWNIGVYARNPNFYYSIECNNITVSFNRTMIAYSSGAAVSYSVGASVPDISIGPRKTTLLDAVVDALSPQYAPPTLDGGVFLEFSVKIRTTLRIWGWIYGIDEHVIEAKCENMSVGIASNATQGVWSGKPESCFSHWVKRVK